MREQTSGLIGELGDTQAVPFLISALENVKYPDMGHVAMLKALGELRDKRSLPCLITWLNRDKGHIIDPWTITTTVRCAAALALGNINDPTAIDALLKAFAEESYGSYLKARILQSLDKLDQPILNHINSVLKDMSCPEEVIELAKKRGDASFVAFLIDRIRTADGIFQASAAVEALTNILSRNIGDVNTETLRLIAAFDESHSFYSDSDYGSAGTLYCNNIKHIAQQEIERRTLNNQGPND